MTKNVTMSMTFTTMPAQVTAADGTFAAFAVGDPIVVSGSAINNGNYLITGSDGSTYLTLDPPPKNGGPAVVNLRTQ